MCVANSIVMHQARWSYHSQSPSTQPWLKLILCYSTPPVPVADLRGDGYVGSAQILLAWPCLFVQSMMK